jgi:hypothetical protein
MPDFGYSFEERIHAEGANFWSSYDFITGMHFNGSPQIVEIIGRRLPPDEIIRLPPVEITGRRLPPAELPPWAFTTDHGGWTLAPKGGGGPSVIGVAKPIDLVPHAENLVKAIVSRDPIGVLEVGVSIFIEMAQNSRVGYAGLSQLAIP